LVSIGHTDGFPRSWNHKTRLHAIIGSPLMAVVRNDDVCRRLMTVPGVGETTS